MKKLVQKFGFEKLRNIGLGSVLVLIILCELPWILALLGFGVLGSRFKTFSDNLLIEILSVVAISAGLGIWTYLRFGRKDHNRRKSQAVQLSEDS